MRYLVWVLCILLAVMFVDATGRCLILKGDARLDVVRSTTADSRRLFVYYPGKF